jgi:hypothetical protein
MLAMTYGKRQSRANPDQWSGHTDRGTYDLNFPQTPLLVQ